VIQNPDYKILCFCEDRKTSTCNGGETVACGAHSQFTMGLNHRFVAQNDVN